MEAMACGAALVTYDNGGCPRLRARRRDRAGRGAARRGRSRIKLERLAVDSALRAAHREGGD